METLKTNQQPQRVKLIFNPGSGANDESPLQIMAVMADDIRLGESSVRIKVQPQALSVMVGATASHERQ